MCAWLGRMPWALAAVLFLVAPAIGAGPSSAELQRWVRQLDADDFWTREQAACQLAAAGEVAVVPLCVAISSNSPEAAWRATRVLEQIALCGNDVTLSRVIETLVAQNDYGRAGLELANDLQAKQSRLRHDRAVATFRSLGGRFEQDPPEPSFIAEGLILGGVVPRIIIQPEEDQKLGIELPEPDAAEPRGDVAARPAAGIDIALEAIGALLSEPAADAKAPPAEPAPPPDAPPPEDAPPDLAFPIPFIGDAFVGEALVAEVLLPDLAEDAEGSPAESVTIGKQWRGGDRGLAALRDLPVVSLGLHSAPLTDAALDIVATLPKLQSLKIEGSAFSTARLMRLHAQQPDLQIYARGKALLGVSCDHSGLCVVKGVQAGSGAAAAGLQAGDQITAVGSQQIRDFSDLTIAVYAHQPGASVPIEFLRSGEQRTEHIVLTERAAAGQ